MRRTQTSKGVILTLPSSLYEILTVDKLEPNQRQLAVTAMLGIAWLGVIEFFAAIISSQRRYSAAIISYTDVATATLSN